MMVVLGELGGRDGYSLVEALNKPVVAWVSGTCTRLFKSQVQFVGPKNPEVATS
jgi:ATP citrate (pro-S)-lyase